MKFFTSQYRYNGPNRVDITVKTGDKAFAPRWNMVMSSKDGTLSHDDYTEQYLNMMRKSYKKHKDEWNSLLQMDEAVIVCFCPSGKFCHRHIFAEILQKLGAVYLGELELSKKK